MAIIGNAATPEASETPETSAGGQDDNLIKDGNQNSFMADVIEASKEALVLVDFWAPWCGPCKQLGPTLEKVIQARKGAVRLVKINVDENQAIAQQLKVQSIPAVFAFKNGQPVDAFMGALPESQVAEFIDKHADPVADDPIVEMLAMGEHALENDNADGAVKMFDHILSVEAGHLEAISGLVRSHLALKDVVRAEEALNLVPDNKKNDPAIESVAAAVELAKQAEEAGDSSELAAKVEANPANHEMRFEYANALLGGGDNQGAVDQLLEIVRRDRAWNEEAARKQLLTLFEAFGPEDPATLDGRAQLSTILFS